MESNEALASALVKFQRWCEDGGPMLYSKIDKLETQIAALAEENEYLKEEVTILESEVVHRDARIAELSAANGEVENLNVEGNLTYEAMKSRSDQLKKGDSNAQ